MYKNVGDIVNVGLCIGCGACFGTCHVKQFSIEKCEKGFPIPKIPIGCDNCGKCLNNCFIASDNSD